MRTLFRKLGQIGWSFPIILALLALCIASIFAITSATSANDALRDAPASQTKYIMVGFIVYLAVALTPYQMLVRISPVLYGVGVLLLIACFVPHIGKKTFGAYSWIKIGPFGSSRPNSPSSPTCWGSRGSFASGKIRSKNFPPS